MGSSDSDKGVYEKLEDKYYDFLDWLNEKNIPIYKVVDAIESKNIPSFPIALILLAVVLIGLFLIISGPIAGNGQLSVSVTDDSGSPVASAVVSAKFQGGEASGKTDKDGKASISVPRGTDVEVTASKPGYKLDKPIAAKLDSEQGSASLKLIKEIKMVSKTISVFEAGTQRAFSDDLQVQLSCTGNKDFTGTQSVERGIIEVSVPDNCDQLTVRALGGYSVVSDTIYLSGNDLEIEVSKSTAATGSVVVTVANSKGDTLPGIDVRLYSEANDGSQGSLIEEKATTTNGSAAFTGVPAGKYYAVAFDRQGNYGEYDGLKQRVVQEVKADSTATIAVVMGDSVAGKIKIMVQDKSTQDPVSGAAVSISKGQTSITSKRTDESGKADFSVSEDVQYTITVDKAGYLITSVKLKPSQDTATIQVEQATVENSQGLFVTVVDEKDKPIENARLKLRKNSDGTQVGSEIVTGLDGRGTFERVEEGAYYVYAVKPGYGEKASDMINVSNRQQNVLKIKIPLGTGKISAAVVDEQGNPVAGATIKTVDTFSFESLDESATDSDGKKEILVRADKKAFLVISASGFANYTTTPMQMQRDVSVEKRVVLPKAVQAFGIEPDGLYSGTEKVSEKDSALAPGQAYTAKFRLLVPKNAVFDEVEAHIRTGADQSSSMEKDSVYITAMRGAYNSISMGTTYTPPTGQAADFQRLTSGNAKWGSATFKSAKGGVYEIEADIQVRDEAKIGSSGEIWYRASAKSGGYLRAPVDAVLGTNASTGQKQGLYANALKMSFSIGPSSLCSEDFCASYSVEDIREGITSGVADSFTAQIESKYRLSFEISGLSRTPFSSAQLLVKDKTAGIAMSAYKIRTAMGEEKTGSLNGSEIKLSVGDIVYGSVVSGEIEFTAKKDGTIPIEFTVLSGTGSASEVYRKIIFARVQSAKQMGIDVLPKVIVPLINNNILVKVSNTDGAGIPNAKVSIRKDGEAIASGDTDFEGVFAYTLSSPADGSTIMIGAEKTGYRASQLEMKASSNVIITDPKTIRLNINVDSLDPKTFEARILNNTQIPLQIEKIAFSKSLDGYVSMKVFEPADVVLMQPDSNILMSGSAKLGPQGALVTQPTRVLGSAIIIATSSAFGQKWVAQVPIEINIGFGDEVDDTSCFVITSSKDLKNPAEWNIYGSPNETQQMTLTVANTCKSGQNKVSLKNVSARVISGSQGIFGTFTAGAAGGSEQQLDSLFRNIADSMDKDSDLAITFKFKPDNVMSGKADVRIELQASHFTQTGEQKLMQKINAHVSVNNINECIEVLTDRDVVVQSCPYNLGYGNYGNRFSQYSNSRYGAYDPMTSRYGYGTGQPPYLGTASTPNTYNDMYSSYGYSNSYYPNSYMGGQFYGGMGTYSAMATGMWSCGTGGFQVRNSCQSPIELTFDAQPGITVKDKTITIEPGKESDVLVEPSNFFGRYALDIKAKPVESSQKTNKIKTVYVNVTNPWTKNYRDCISIDPARTIAFNNFLGSPVTLKVINTCYAEGVYLEESTATIFFPGLTIANPADTGMNYPSGNYSNFNPITGQPYNVGNNNNANNVTANQSAGSARELIESYTFLGPDYQTQPNGKVTQVLSFELVKALKQYRNRAPKADIFGPNIFKDIGNLRYFLTSGYYAVQSRTSLIVKFMNPFGMQQQIAFPVIVQDLWNALEYAERVNEEFETFGSPAKKPSECINHKALDFTALGRLPTDRVYYTKDNGGLFNINEQTGCGTVDSLSDFSPSDMTFRTGSGLVMKVQPDPSDPRHNLAISFDTTGWKGAYTPINQDILAKVNRTITGSAELVRLKVLINAKEENIQGPTGTCPDGSRPGPSGTCPSNNGVEAALCAAGGETGTKVYNKYGFGNLLYDWRSESIKANTCDSITIGPDGKEKDRPLTGAGAPVFCDATQLTLSLQKKVDEITSMASLIKATGNVVGECVKNSGLKDAFDCERPGNKTAENLFRYVLKQNKLGYFIGQDGKLLDLGKLNPKDFKIEEQVSAVPASAGSEDTHNKNVVTKALEALDALERNKGEKWAGADPVLEVTGWEGSTTLPNFLLGAKEVEKGNYVVTYADFKQVMQKVLACIDSKADSCTLANGALANTLTAAQLKSAFSELERAGQWKFAAGNTENLGSSAQEELMRKGVVGDVFKKPMEKYRNLREFNVQNIDTKAYLVKENYSQAFIEAFNSSEAGYKAAAFSFANNGGESAFRAEAGEYSVWLAEYNWEGKTAQNQDYSAKVNMVLERAIEEIDAAKKTSFAENPLFMMPMDGKVNWGTAIEGTAADKIYLNFINDRADYPFKKASDSDKAEKIKADFDSSYKTASTGKILSISEMGIVASLSDPVAINVNIAKTKKESPAAGIFYEFRHNNAKEAFDLRYTDSDTKADAASDRAPFFGSQLCDAGSADPNASTANYYGLLFSGGETFNRNFVAHTYVPARASEEDTGSVLEVKCIKDSGKISSTYGLDKATTIGTSSTRGQLMLSLNPDKTKAPFKKEYNLQKLIAMVNGNEGAAKACVKVEKGSLELYWNPKYFSQAS